MERFAVIGMMYDHERYIQVHPVMRRLSPKWGRSLIVKMGGPRITGTILDVQGGNELGYIIDVPSFYMDWDMLTDGKRLKHIKRLLKVMEKQEVRIMVMPLMKQLFSKQEYDYCTNRGFILLDGFHIRLASLVEAAERVFVMLKKEIHTMEAVVWRADTDVGEMWAEFLAPHFNYMILGGRDKNRLEKLSEKIINATGLACAITDEIDDITEEHDIMVWTEKTDTILYPKSTKLVFISGHISKEYLARANKDSEILSLISGWIRCPEDISYDVDLYPLEEIGVLEGLFYIISEFYRMIVHQDNIDLKQIMDLRDLLKLYPLHCEGVISSNRSVSYNGFRRAYFRRS